MGILYGITYVDFNTKCVFNGSDLGKRYSAKGVQERCVKAAVENKEPAQESFSKTSAEKHFTDTQDITEKPANIAADLIENLFKTEHTSGFIPHQLKGKKKKKKRGNHL